MLKRFFLGLVGGVIKAAAVLALIICLTSAWGGLRSLWTLRPALRGEMVDIGGRRLRIVCEGPRSERPLVLLESGIYGYAADWGEVQKRLTARGWRSCAYDRAGLGFSDPGPAPRDSVAIVRDLETLLTRKGEEGPYIVVGHSMAGLHTRLFAHRHPEAVRGLVLVDAVSPDSINRRYGRRLFMMFRALGRSGAVFTSLGLAKAFPNLADSIGLDGPAHVEKVYFFGAVRQNHWAAAEAGSAMQSAREVQALGPLDPDLPVGVVTEGSEATLRSDWGQARVAPARASRRGFAVNLPDATHATMLGRKHAGAIVAAIERVVEASGPPRP